MVIAALGAGTGDAEDPADLTAGYVLMTAIAGPLATKYADRLPGPPGAAPAGAAGPDSLTGAAACCHSVKYSGSGSRPTPSVYAFPADAGKGR